MVRDNNLPESPAITPIKSNFRAVRSLRDIQSQHHSSIAKAAEFRAVANECADLVRVKAISPGVNSNRFAGTVILGFILISSI